MKKPRFRRFGISTGSKAQQANLRALAKEMAQDPAILIPGCAGKCSRCPFDKLLVRLRKIQAYRDNAAVLKKFASGGKPLERGYAAMLILAIENTPIMFATAKLPTGDVGYTVRGKAKKEVLIGLQHFEDPKLRLLAYSEFALKKRLHLYSLNDDLLCSGSSPAYPPELISEVIRSSVYHLKKGPSGHRCEHADDGGLAIEIISAKQKIEICKSCASGKNNLLNGFKLRVLARRPDDDFDVEVKHDIVCARGTGCSLSGNSAGTSGIIARYRDGKISDDALVKEYRAAVRGSADPGKALFVLGNTCYEDDAASFIKALGPTEFEEIALKRVLKGAASPVVMDTATPNAVLAQFWDRSGAGAIHSVIGDKELARKIFTETKDSGKMPSQIIRDAIIQSKSKNALAALPDFKGLSKLGNYADEVARTYKALGREETLKRLASAHGDTKSKSVNCGFLYALDALKGKEWQFTKEELDYGKYLADFARALLDSQPADFADALQNLLTAAGSDETVR
ncbi:MAG: hypothetical protein R6W91_00185 [Thermoplasmata archaeon]